MHVCLLIPTLDAFKGGNHLPLLAALSDVRFTIVTNRVKPRDAVLPPNVRVEIMSGRLGPYYYGCSDALFARAVLRKYPADHAFWKQFDVIHLNQTMGPKLLRLKETGVPLLLLIHHPVSADRRIAIEESSVLEGWRWRLKYALLCRWQQRFCREIAHIATVSATAAERIAADYGCDKSRIHIVPNGVQEDLFVPGDVRSADFDVIAIGAFIHPRKGFRYLAEAYRKLGESGLRIADVGRRSLEQRQELSAIQGVQIFGTVPEDMLLSLLQRSSVLISTSLYEGFGLSLIEALSCGRPAFAFEAGAVREVLEPIDPTLIVPARDTDALVRRIRTFLELPTEERVRKGEQYRADVVRLYSLTQSAVALKRLYGLLSRQYTRRDSGLPLP